MGEVLLPLVYEISSVTQYDASSSHRCDTSWHFVTLPCHQQLRDVTSWQLISCSWRFCWGKRVTWPPPVQRRVSQTILARAFPLIGLGRVTFLCVALRKDKIQRLVFVLKLKRTKTVWQYSTKGQKEARAFEMDKNFVWHTTNTKYMYFDFMGSARIFVLNTPGTYTCMLML